MKLVHLPEKLSLIWHAKSITLELNIVDNIVVGCSKFIRPLRTIIRNMVAGLR